MYIKLFNGIMSTSLDSFIAQLIGIYFLQSQYAPRLAGLINYSDLVTKQKLELTATSLAYLSRMPRFTFNFALSEESHSALRRCCSSSSTNQSILLVAESMMMRSPSFTSAIGPPTRASGTTWPMINPRLAPENRPSVIRAVEFANPAPAIAPVGPKRDE